MDEFDIRQDPVGHNMLKRGPRRLVATDCREGVYPYGHFGIPCTTFTVLLALQRRCLRLRHMPYGRKGLNARDYKAVTEANILIRFSCRCMRMIFDSGGEFTFESVTDRGDPDIPQCYWPARSSMCPLALVPEVVALIQYARVEQFHIPLSSFHEGDGPPPPIKWVTIFASPGAAAILAPLRGRVAPTDMSGRATAIGRDEHGQSRASATAAYPEGLNRWLSLVAERYASDDRPDGEAAPPGAQIGCGARLHSVIADAVLAARLTPVRFADYRKLRAVPADVRHRMPMPQPHAQPPSFEATAPSTDWAIIEEGPDDERPGSFAPGFLRPLRAHHGIPGLPPGRVSYESVWIHVPEDRECWNDRRGYRVIVEWTRHALSATHGLLSGNPIAGPADLMVPNHLKEEWARPLLLDTRDPHDVVRMRRSTRHTIFPGVRQLDRAKFRAVGAATGWYEIDADIMGQVGEGGVESRSHCPRVTFLAWHHSGIRDNFDEAHKISVKEYRDKWLVGPFALPPTEPCRVIPNNVVMQQRPKLGEDGELIARLKPRVTTNESSGDGISPNAGVGPLDRLTCMPSHQSHAASAAVVDACFAPSGFRAGQYCTDLTGAYSFLVTQRGDWWQQVRLWGLDLDGRIVEGFFLQPRSLFGGAWMPNRFMRFTGPKRAYTRQRQMDFDAAHPYPREVLDVVRERAALQAAQELPAGANQLVIAALQDFVDDESGSAGTDPVPMPACLAHVDVAAVRAETEKSGGRAAAANSRVMVHCCFSIDTSEQLGLEHAMDKVQCGDGIVVLGLRCDILADRSDVPPVKVGVMRAELALMRRLIAAAGCVERSMVERNVGRACNISQIEPSILDHIHAGYAIAHATARKGPRFVGPVGRTAGRQRRRLRSIRVLATSSTGRRFDRFLEDTIAVLTANRGVPLVHQLAFPSPADALTLAVVTDASGEDGVGGYAFLSSRPHDVWIVHAEWTDSVRAAIAASGVAKSARASAAAQPACSMPAAELFGTWAVPETVRLSGVQFSAVIAVGDCKPAAAAVSHAKSTSAVMRHILARVRECAPDWLGVHVRRKWNSDADLLSHPALVHLVIQAAREARLTVHELRVHASCWHVLHTAIAEAFQASHDAPDDDDDVIEDLE